MLLLLDSDHAPKHTFCSVSSSRAWRPGLCFISWSRSGIVGLDLIFWPSLSPFVISPWALLAYREFLPPLLRALVSLVLVLLLSSRVLISAAVWLTLYFGSCCWDSVLDFIRTNGLRLLAPWFFLFYSVFSARPARSPACSFFLDLACLAPC
jgi:hypothetical protein